MSGLSEARNVSISTAGYEDGLGRRSVRFDREVGGMLECLHLRPELGAFEASLRERAGAFTALDDERFVRIRTIARDGQGVVVVSELVAGQRLSDVIETRQRDAAAGFGIDAAFGFLLQTLPALSTLHAASIVHGALAPGRIIVTPSSQIVLLDGIYAPALERLKLNRHALWSTLWLMAPPSAGAARFDRQGDVVQAVMCALVLALGRPIEGPGDPAVLVPLVQEVAELAEIRAGREFADGVQRFLGSALPLLGRRPMVGTDEAAAEIRQLATVIGAEASHAALADLVRFEPAPRMPVAAARPVAVPIVARTAPRPEPPVLRLVESTPVVPDTPEAPAVARAAPTPAPVPKPVSAPEPVIEAAPVVPLAPVTPAVGLTSREAVSAEPRVVPAPPVNLPVVATTAAMPPPAAFTAPPPAPPVTADPPAPPPVSPVPPPVAFTPVAVTPPPSFTPAPVAPPVPKFTPTAPPVSFTPAPTIGLAPIQAKLHAPPPAPAPPAASPVAAPASVRVRAEPPSGYAPARTAFDDSPRALPFLDRAAAEPAGFPWKLAAAVVLVIAVAIVAGRSYLQPAPETASAAAAGDAAGATPPPAAPVEKAGSLVIDSQPSGAKVTMDGADVGVTPLKLDAVSPGRHALVIATETASVRRTVRVEAGKLVTLDVPVYSGWVSVFAPITLEVAAGGRSVGSTETGKIMLPPGRHVLTLSNREFGFTETRTVEIHPGEERPLNVEPMGRVNINAHPWAEVWIDGRKAGETPMANLPVLLGTRSFILKHPLYGDRRITATITTTPAALSVDFTKQ